MIEGLIGDRQLVSTFEEMNADILFSLTLRKPKHRRFNCVRQDLVCQSNGILAGEDITRRKRGPIVGETNLNRYIVVGSGVGLAIGSPGYTDTLKLRRSLGQFFAFAVTIIFH